MCVYFTFIYFSKLSHLSGQMVMMDEHIVHKCYVVWPKYGMFSFIKRVLLKKSLHMMGGREAYFAYVLLIFKKLLNTYQ